jgi:hypothetical protein
MADTKLMHKRQGSWSLIFCVAFLWTALTSAYAGIQGRVTDDGGAAVANLQVLLYSDTGALHSAITDGDGNYSDAASAGNWTIRFDAQELKDRRLAAIQRTQIVSVVEGAVTTYDIQLLRTPYDIQVRLVDENGALYQMGAPDFYVQSMIDGERYQLQGVLSNGEAMVPVAAGSWSVDFNLSSLPARVWGQVVNVTSEPVEATFVLRTGNSDSRFFGQVVDENGAAVPNFAMQLNWNGDIVNADSDGRFDLLLPAGSLYVRSADTNYLLAATFVALSPTQPVERVIPARRAMSGIAVTFNFPEGAQSSSMSVWISTRVGGHSYQVDFFNSTNRLVRLPAFPGRWTVNAAAAGFMALPPKSVEVGSEDVEVAFDFLGTNVSTNTIQGKIVFPSGAPLKYVDVFAEGNPNSGHATTDEAGQFTMKVADGRYNVRIMQWSPMVMKIPVEVKDGADVDLGTIELPNRTVKAGITFVDETGAPIEFSGFNPNNIHLTSDTGTASYEVWDDGLENQRSVLLMPGTWRMEAESLDEGFAVPAAVTLEVGDTDVEVKIALRRLDATPTAPALNIFQGDQAPVFTLRMVSPSAKYVDIESSSDLKVWKYYATQTMTDGSADLTVPVVVENPILYFRAVNADLLTQ